MLRSSGCKHDRGQVHPLPALVAVLVLTLALTAYADVAQPISTPGDSAPAIPALKRVESNATTGAVLDPAAVSVEAAGLVGYNVNLTVTTPIHRHVAGPPLPSSATGGVGGTDGTGATGATEVTDATGATGDIDGTGATEVTDATDVTEAKIAVAVGVDNRTVPGTLTVEVWA